MCIRDSDNAEILASTILEFASMDPKERSEMGSKGPLYGEKNYSIAVLAAKLEEVL